MRDVRSNVLHVNFRRPQPKRPKRRGLAIAFGAGDGFVYISASGRQKLTIKEVNSLIRELRDVRDDAKARRRG
jgi:hypothetical protein